MSGQAPEQVLGARRRLAHLFQALALLVLLALPSYLVGRHLWAAHYLRAAQEALEQEDAVKAWDQLTHYLKLRPDNPEVLLLAARTARRAGAYDEAAELLDHCLALQGETPAIAVEQCLLRVGRGDLDPVTEAQLWSLINQSHPETVLILEALTPAYIYSYRLGTALECLNRWLEHRPDSIQCLLLRAQVWQGLKRPEDALSDYRRAVALDPDHDEARLQLAVFLAYSGRKEEAVDHFEHLGKRQPKNLKVVLGLARCREYQGRPEEARQLLEAILTENPQDVPALRERGKLALHLEQRAEAENWLRQCLDLDPWDQEGTYLLSSCLEQLGKKDEASAYRTRLAQIEADLKRLEELNRKAGKDPDNAGLRQEAGAICLRNGQEREGLRWLAGALQVDPNHRLAHQTLADYYQSLGKRDLAERHRQLAGRKAEG